MRIQCIDIFSHLAETRYYNLAQMKVSLNIAETKCSDPLLTHLFVDNLVCPLASNLVDPLGSIEARTIATSPLGDGDTPPRRQPYVRQEEETLALSEEKVVEAQTLQRLTQPAPSTPPVSHDCGCVECTKEEPNETLNKEERRGTEQLVLADEQGLRNEMTAAEATEKLSFGSTRTRRWLRSQRADAAQTGFQYRGAERM